MGKKNTSGTAKQKDTTSGSGSFRTTNHGRWDEYFRGESLPVCPGFIFFLLATDKGRVTGKAAFWAAPALPFLYSSLSQTLD